MFEKLLRIENRYDEISNMLSDPSVISNQDKFRELMKEINELGPIVEKFSVYKKIKETMEESEEMLSEKLDKEFKEMVEEELRQAKSKIPQIEDELRILLLPTDPNDKKSVIIEIRGGAGGDEAALFAAVLYRMYTMYAEKNHWKYEMLDCNETGIGGFKEVVFSINAEGVYSKLKYESGVHRVQRVPETESQGRIHTSTVTVAVLPEAEEFDFNLDPGDVDVDTYRASGAGGQHVNKTSSAIRLTHRPSGLVVTCQDERSQHKNKDKAFTILRSRLYDIELAKKEDELASDRKSQVGTGDRSERIRTYNYPQGRVTDHRIGLTLYKLDDILNGNMTEVVDSLITDDQSKKLAKQE